GVEFRDDDKNPVTGEALPPVAVGSQSGCIQECTDFDVTDPTMNGAETVDWEQVSGVDGRMVFKTRLNQITPGDAQGFSAIPYYRDDACFDDGTGIDPGPHVHAAKTDDSTPAPTASDPPANMWQDPATGQL